MRIPFDPADPPDEPPAGVAAMIPWRVAVRLYRDHEATDHHATGPAVTGSAVTGSAVTGPAAGYGRPRPRCRQCANLWPCAARRLALCGLLAASGAAPWQNGPDLSGAA